MQFMVFLGALRYEYLMQSRRRAIWVTFLLFALAIIGFLFAIPPQWHEALSHLNRYSLREVIVNWASYLNYLTPVLVGVLLADRLPYDRRTKMNELLVTVPGALDARIWGKYIGSLLATLLPVVLLYGCGLAYIFWQVPDPGALPLALSAFFAIIMPGMLFIGAFSLACPAVLWVPVYQFLYVGYWLWGNTLPTNNGIPTLSNTLLTPIGGYAVAGFFHVVYAENSDLQIARASIWQALASVSLLLGIALLVMVTLCRFLQWRQEQA